MILAHKQPNLAMRRLAARLLDLLFVAACYEMMQRVGLPSMAPMVGLLLYQVLVCLSRGQSLGKALLGLQVVGSPLRLLGREALLWLLWPFVLLSFVSHQPLHDRWSNLEVRLV